MRWCECLCVIIFGNYEKSGKRKKYADRERERKTYPSTVGIPKNLSLKSEIWKIQILSLLLDVSIKWSFKMVLHVILCKT